MTGFNLLARHMAGPVAKGKERRDPGIASHGERVFVPFSFAILPGRRTQQRRHAAREAATAAF